MVTVEKWSCSAFKIGSDAKEHNPRFAECAELAARSAFSLVICGTLERMRMALFDRVLRSFGLSWSDGKTHNSQCWLHVSTFYKRTLVDFLHFVCFASFLKPLCSVQAGLPAWQQGLPFLLPSRVAPALDSFVDSGIGLGVSQFVSFWMIPVVLECCARFLCCDCSKLCCLALGISGSAVWAMKGDLFRGASYQEKLGIDNGCNIQRFAWRCTGGVQCMVPFWSLPRRLYRWRDLSNGRNWLKGGPAFGQVKLHFFLTKNLRNLTWCGGLALQKAYFSSSPLPPSWSVWKMTGVISISWSAKPQAMLDTWCDSCFGWCDYCMDDWCQCCQWNEHWNENPLDEVHLNFATELRFLVGNAWQWMICIFA